MLSNAKTIRVCEVEKPSSRRFRDLLREISEPFPAATHADEQINRAARIMTEVGYDVDSGVSKHQSVNTLTND